MTTLKDDGLAKVAKWTANKKMNIFEKKFIFIPVNANLHWSLCVVVNPGLIENNHREGTLPDEDAWYVQTCSLYWFYLAQDSHQSIFLQYIVFGFSENA